MKKLFWRLFLIKLIFKACVLPFVFMFYAEPANAEVASAASTNMNRAMSGIIQDAMASRGYVPNDPRTYSTLANAGRYIGAAAGVGAAITIGAISAPAWLSFVLASAVGGLISAAVGFAADSLLRYYFKPDGRLEVEKPANGGSGVVAAGAYWKSSILGIVGSDPMAVLTTVISLNWPEDATSTYKIGACTTTSNPTKMSCGVTRVNKSTGYEQKNYAAVGATYYADGAPHTCNPGFVYRESIGDCVQVPGQVSSPQPITPQQVAEQLSDEELSKPLNPQILAAMANGAWQQAASQQGYDGFPYPLSNPITVEEVARWLERNPQLAPTVNDFVKPNPVTSENPQPWALPTNPTAPNPTPIAPTNPSVTNPGSENPLVNLGPDPGIGAPSLENPPTAQQILDPILNLAPGLRGFQVNAPAGVCPKPTIEVYGTHQLEAHCTLIEQNKPLLKSSMAFAWAAMALFIILSA